MNCQSGQMERAVQKVWWSVNYLSENTRNIQRHAGRQNQDAEQSNRKSYDQIFEEMKELEEKKSVEPLLLVQKKFVLWRHQNARDEARSLQRSGSSRRMKKEVDLQIIDGGSR